MKEYTVEQIANALDKSTETVRRLIRTGVLPTSALTSKKDGFKISEEAFRGFLDKYPKYLTSTATALLASSVVPVSVPFLLTGVIVGLLASNSKKVSPKQVEDYVHKQMNKLEKDIQKNIEQIKSLENEKKKLQIELEKKQNEVEEFKKWNNNDYVEIAKSINEKKN